ncbi:CHRD domain-containing protein [Bythopirellula goksoeyrii]|uniref:CHRD domain protein n=1 Tax=Bythopirellula goksoeyrii TaxID=1400387 RepID=A0A5B9Q7W7_9BACT|nr:CHRD domain-containing protein [Bythopirellula goksoeyrii]QEG33749.1 CHRD domain protein [Bythopirellula goksoeyrii]
MQRIWIFLFQLSLLGLLGKSQAHEQSHLGSASGGHGYYAFLDDFHTHPSTTEATGEIFLSLNSDQTRLTYRIVLDHLLGLKPNAIDRTEPDDIIGIHLHLHVPDTIGPHVLNIFGLATYNQPAEEDADRVIDYENRTITGVWDDGDATIDPTTGLPYLPFYPLTSKPLTNWLDTLNEGRLMVAVHTNESGFPSMAIRGHISPIPEPSSWGLLASAVMLWMGRRSSLRRGEVL